MEFFKKDSVSKKSLKLFDNHQSLEILWLNESLNKNTTDTETSKYITWKLCKENILTIIRNSKMIGGTTGDFYFWVLSCTKSLEISQNCQYFFAEINAASFFSITNGDTTILGNFKNDD